MPRNYPISEIERLTLLNQYRILSKLDEEADYSAEIDILRFGITGMYNILFEGMDNQGRLSSDIVDETLDILDMYRHLESAIEDSNLPDIESIKFNGFDANQHEHYIIMRFYVEKLEKYDEHANTDYNSHSSISINIYRRLLAAYNANNLKDVEPNDGHLQLLINAI